MNFEDCLAVFNFNFDKYFVSSDTEKKMMQLQAVHQGMLGIAVEQGWNTEPFEIAYQACLDADLVLNTPLKKRKMSQIGRAHV